MIDLQDPIMQIGVGGTLALLIIREVLTFLRHKKEDGKNGSSGNRSVEFWQQEGATMLSKAIADVLTNRLDMLRQGQLESESSLRDAAMKAMEASTKMIGLLERIERLMDRRFGSDT